MPAPTATPLVASSALDQAEPWASFAAYRTWANGGFGGAAADYDRVKSVHLPRPQVYDFPVHALLGETQDVRGQARIGVADDTELKHRQIIYGDCLDTGTHRVRIAGCSQRFKMPTYGRVSIQATISHRCWPGSTVYGGATPDPTGYFSLWWGAAGGTPTEIAGSRRSTRRQIGAIGTGHTLDPAINISNLLGALDTSNAASYPSLGGMDLDIFVGFTAGPTTFFGNNSTGGINKNRNRVDILNTTFVVRVWKNVVS